MSAVDPGARRRPLTALETAVLEAATSGLVTSRALAERLHVTRPGVRVALRRLEREGLLRAALIGGGELGYTPTARARRLELEVAS